MIPGSKGLAMATAHFIAWSSNLQIYGGFLRDCILRNELHEDSDLDVNLNGMSFDEGDQHLSRWAEENGIQIVEREDKGDFVKRVKLRRDSSSLSVEFVDQVAAEARQRWAFGVDFDVNNIRFMTAEGLQKRYTEQGCSIEEMRIKIEKKEMCMLNYTPINVLRARKFRERGWTVNVIANPPASMGADNFYSEGGYFPALIPREKTHCGHCDHKFCRSEYKISHSDPTIVEDCFSDLKCGCGDGGIPWCCLCGNNVEKDGGVQGLRSYGYFMDPK